MMGYAAFTYIQFGQETIKPKLEVKLLEVFFYQKLTCKHHIAKAVKRDIKVALALRRLKNLKSKTACQLCISIVVLVVNYTLPIWTPSVMQTSFHILDTIQRIGAQVVIGGFCTVVQYVADLEAGIEPANSRHHNQPRTIWVK